MLNLVVSETLTEGRSAPKRSLYGLLLAGGHSQRMGKPKANISFEGSPMYERGLHILDGICERSFISCRRDSIPELLQRDNILDKYPSNGPITGILSALEKYKEVSWLVIPVDMPKLTMDFLQDTLIVNQNQGVDATVIRNLSDGVLQPLVAIYEPSSFPFLQNAFERRSYSIKTILSKMNVHYVDIDDPEVLINRNRPEDWSDADIS